MRLRTHMPTSYAPCPCRLHPHRLVQRGARDARSTKVFQPGHAGQVDHLLLRRGRQGGHAWHAPHWPGRPHFIPRMLAPQNRQAHLTSQSGEAHSGRNANRRSWVRAASALRASRERREKPAYHQQMLRTSSCGGRTCQPPEGASRCSSVTRLSWRMAGGRGSSSSSHRSRYSRARGEAGSRWFVDRPVSCGRRAIQSRLQADRPALSLMSRNSTPAKAHAWGGG